MKITIKGIAGESYKGDSQITGLDREQYDGIDCQDCFSDYMDKIGDANISGGYMDFVWDDTEKELMVVVEYESDRLLTVAEGKELIDYTQGQMSDGIGEGFEQFDCTGDDDYISPWFSGQELTIYPTQQEIREEKIETVLD